MPKDFNSLKTTAKETLVDAINENYDKIGILNKKTNGIVNIKEYESLVVNGDWTPAVQSAYDSISSTGGELFFPQGEYKFNLVINKSNISLRGVGRSASSSQGGVGGTRLLPTDLTKPVLQIGDGTSIVNSISLSSFSIEGDQNTITSDGLVLLGAYYVNAWDFEIRNFGRDNIRIESTATRASFNNNFNQFVSRWARGSSFKVLYGATWVTATSISNFLLSGYSNVGCTALYSDGAEINAANGWIQTGNGVGHVYLSGSGVKLLGHNVAVDSDAQTDTVLEFNFTPGLVSSYVTGTLTVDGKAKWNDGYITPHGANGNNLTYHTRLSYPHVVNALLFGQQDAANNSATVTPETISDSSARLYRTGASPNEVLRVQSAALRPLMTYQYPLQGSANGAIWRNGTTGQIRYRSNTWFPGTDNDGVPFSTFVAVPTSATATGNPGEWSADANYIYVCHVANTWKRVAIATW
jgi:hypothetical protein